MQKIRTMEHIVVDKNRRNRPRPEYPDTATDNKENTIWGTIAGDLFALNWVDAHSILERNSRWIRHLQRQIRRLKKPDRIRGAKRPLLRREVWSCASC